MFPELLPDGIRRAIGVHAAGWVSDRLRGAVEIVIVLTDVARAVGGLAVSRFGPQLLLLINPDGSHGACVILRLKQLGGVVKRTILFRVFRGEDQYVAECVDLPVVTQAPTLDELAANIREALALHLEGEDLAELGLAEHPAVLATMELDAVA